MGPCGVSCGAWCVVRAQRLVGFADPSSRRTHPGWPLRNFLLLLVRWVCRDMTSVPVICYRQLPGKRNIDSSLIIPVLLPDPAGKQRVVQARARSAACPSLPPPHPQFSQFRRGPLALH
jgi:hypothetical protein